MSKLTSYSKAIVAFLAPGVVTIGGALTVNSDGGGSVTPYEWVTALIACLVTGGFVYAIPNRPPEEYVPERALNQDGIPD